MSKLAPAPLPTSLEQSALPSSAQFPFLSLGFLALRKKNFLIQPFEDKSGKKVLGSEKYRQKSEIKWKKVFRTIRWFCVAGSSEQGQGVGGERKVMGGDTRGKVGA